MRETLEVDITCWAEDAPASQKHLVQAQVFSEKLKKTLNAYHNRAIATMQVIDELIKLAKDLDVATKRGEDLGLTDDEIAFNDALASNDSAKRATGDDNAKVMVAELIAHVKTVLMQAELLCADWV